MNQAKPLVSELSNRYPEDTIIYSIWLPAIRAALLLQGKLQRGGAGNEAALALEQLQTASRYSEAFN